MGYYYYFIIYNNYFFFVGWGGSENLIFMEKADFVDTFFFCSFLCIYRGFLKFKVQNGNTFCRYLNLKYFLGMPDIPDYFFGAGGG